MKPYYFIFLFPLLFLSCGSKEHEEKKTQAITTAEAIRDHWLRSRKALEFIVETKQPGALEKMSTIGIFSYSKDATVEEQYSLKGVPFRYESDGKFIPEVRDLMTGDSTAIFYACYPYFSGVTPKDTLSLHAPYSEYLYGSEISRSFGKQFSVRLRMQCAMSLLRFRLESENITDHLHKVTVSGQEIYTHAGYMPYTGEWYGLSGANSPIEYQFDRVMNNYQFVDVLLPPVDTPCDVTVTVGINSNEYTLHTTVPRLKRGEMTQLNLFGDTSGLKITSSWIEERRDFQFAPKVVNIDTVRIGNYLQNDGTVSAIRDSTSVAMVYMTDGKHGKAIALKDCEGLKLFSSQRLTSGRFFQTVDGTKKEGFINPSRTDVVEEKNRLIYKPSLPYPDSCAFGYTDGCTLCRTLTRKYKDTGNDDMLAELLTVKGAYVPSVAELVHVYYLLQRYADKRLAMKEVELPKGEYLSSSESSIDNFYMFDFTHGVVTGAFSKQFARLRLRLFYVF